MAPWGGPAIIPIVVLFVACGSGETNEAPALHAQAVAKGSGGPPPQEEAQSATPKKVPNSSLAAPVVRSSTKPNSAQEPASAQLNLVLPSGEKLEQPIPPEVLINGGMLIITLEDKVLQLSTSKLPVGAGTVREVEVPRLEPPQPRILPTVELNVEEAKIQKENSDALQYAIQEAVVGSVVKDFGEAYESLERAKFEDLFDKGALVRRIRIRDGKISVAEYTLPEDLDRLVIKLETYDRIRVEVFGLSYTQLANPAYQAKYDRVIEVRFEQVFRGYRDGRDSYCDVTQKKLLVGLRKRDQRWMIVLEDGQEPSLCN